MYLKSIEIQGFKSFANKIVFEFHNGITGIVGPNGSGKSNVADAVRWVLGEQRAKQLRGANMQDVIFAGTEMRKPQGFAYVAITLDNSDHKLPIEYNEVTVSRRVYRSGESEYMINKTVCRLKDINELFYDTGIGKEGYSIIGQGQIDKILSGKPEERRELFDEAAGIVKFKRRKNMAQKKLEDEKQNLIRVTDIVTELEKQVAPLEKQAETAKAYLKLRDELKVYDINLFLAETDSKKIDKEEVVKNIEIVQGNLTEVNIEAEKIKTDYDKLESSIALKQVEVDRANQKLHELNLSKEEFTGKINILNEHIKFQEANIVQVEERLAVLEKEKINKQEEKQIHLQSNEEIKSNLGNIKDEEQQLSEKLKILEKEITSLEQFVENKRTNIMDSLDEKASIEAQRQKYETMLDNILAKKSEIAGKILKFKSDEAVQDEIIKTDGKKLIEIEDKLSVAKHENELQIESINNGEKTVIKSRQKLGEIENEYRRAAANLDSLKNIAERYDGYGNSIRKIMELKISKAGIRGVVADLITTKDTYETAIETALGGSIQNIVTDTDNTAKELIEYLKKNKFGRATFLPLSAVKNRNPFKNDTVFKENGVLGLANELVECEAEYKELLASLLGRVIVVDKIENAIILAKKYNYTFRIVTLEGELLNAGGSMSGGAFKNSSNLLGRKREIEILTEKYSELKIKQKSELEILNEAERNLLAVKKLSEETKQILQELLLQQNTLAGKTRQADLRKQEIKFEYEGLSIENFELESKITEIRQNKNNLENEVSKIGNMQEDFKSEIELKSQNIESKKIQASEWNERITNLQIEISGSAQKEQFALTNIERINIDCERILVENDELIQKRHNSNKAITEKQKEISEIKINIQENIKFENDIAENIKKCKENLDNETELQRSLFSKRDEISVQISKLDKELYRLESRRDSIEQSLEYFIEYIWNEYELTPRGASEYYNEELGAVNVLKGQVNSIKNQIKAMGNVNVNAIEDLKEIAERYEFLKNQHDDLVEAEAALLGVIEELDTGMRMQFEEKFREIKSEFDKVFKELFGGGRGTLELSDSDDILEAGIQIISQPPGKKLQNMMQLSGGEKALTAIALLFAIQNLKPSPFCLLDEIEAALDDSNVGRFAGYLNKLTKFTQFIIITHRRGTMVAADRLYGITMQEKGVSTLVSVNLIESELDSEAKEVE